MKWKSPWVGAGLSLRGTVTQWHGSRPPAVIRILRPLHGSPFPAGADSDCEMVCLYLPRGSSLVSFLKFNVC